MRFCTNRDDINFDHKTDKSPISPQLAVLGAEPHLHIKNNYDWQRWMPTIKCKNIAFLIFIQVQRAAD